MPVGTVNAGFPMGTDMDQFDIGLLALGTYSAETTTSFTVNLGPEVVVLGGAGFTFDANGVPTGGTVTSLQDQYLGVTNFSLTGLNVSAASLAAWALADDKASALSGFFGGADTITGGSFGDQLRAYGGADSLSGGLGDDTLDGGVGNDTLSGGAGHDVLITGGGVDKIVIGLGESGPTLAGADVVTDWNSADTLTFASGPAGTADYAEASAADFASALSLANQQIAGGTVNVVAVQVAGDVVVFADSGNDNGTADDAIVLSGRTLNDTSAANLTFSPGVSTAPVGSTSSGTTGGTGTTGTTGSTGVPGQTFIAIPSSSTVQGSAGNDTIQGAAVPDYLRGNDGNDVINGGPAFDDINGNVGNDTCHGNNGDDWVVGGKDNDMLFGDGGNDIVWGNLGNDTCDGGDGADQVRGGQGDDSISGGAGNDYVSGDRGNDTEMGGAGADIFHSFSGAGIDRVLDFNSGEGDRVMLDPGTAYTVSQVGSDTIVNMGNGDQLILVGVQLSTLPTGWIFLGP